MERFIQVAASLLLICVLEGCSSLMSTEQPVVTTDFTSDRTERVRTKTEELTAMGVPADLAQRRASRQVPLMETTAMGSFADPATAKIAREKFAADLAKSLNEK